MKNKSADISRLVERCGHPTYFIFTETWLDKSIERAVVSGYVEVSRRDRGTSAHGGIILFAKFGFENSIVHVGTSSVAERTWHIVHSNRGPLLLGCWYRPPDHAEVATIESIDSEVLEFGRNTLGTILTGDMNVHEEWWLRYSDGTSTEGRLLRDVSCSQGWEERVRKPTRGDHLLDLVLTDLGSEVKTKVVNSVSDHKAVLASLEFSVTYKALVERLVYDYGKADWDTLKQKFKGFDWDNIFSGLSTDQIAEVFMQTIVNTVDEIIPSKVIMEDHSEHPWLNDRCRKTIDCKTEAQGSDHEIFARDECSQVLVEEHGRYSNRMRRKLHNLPQSSKG